jgi:hypothetical protein
MRIGVMARGTWLVTPNKFLDAEQVQAQRRSKDTGRDNGDRYAARNTPVVDTLLGAPPTFPGT